MRKISKILVPTLALGLIIGGSSISANTHTTEVEAGDTFWSIANEHGVSVEELLELNSDLDPRAIPIGTQVKVSEQNGEQTGDRITHTVQPGNTLWQIAQTYDGVTVADLYELNEGIDPYQLVVGSKVTVVANEEHTTDRDDVVYHTVQPGNTLYGIARVYDGVTVNDLLEANPDIDVYAIPVGSSIAIPTK